MRRFSILLAAVAVLLVPTAVARGSTTPPPTAFALPDLSTLDYFHPSVAGQTKLAAAAWAAGAGS